MKTLVVLSALAAVALAAPTLLEKGSEDFKKFTNVPDHGSISSLPSTSHISEFGATGRSFGLKKPIIIKKKPMSYQVYRDSDEVPIESGETCGSQVKVKFCDGKTKLKSSTTEDTNTQMTEEDMKHSITLAKEAIENLQRDLNTVEQKPGTQASSWNHGHSESDAELHQDIEVAREALEHIHKNFGNFESMSLHATTFKEGDVVPEASFTIAKTEEQRLAQWKEAIDTINKNVMITKIIEDSLKMAPETETGLLLPNEMIIENNKHDLNKELNHKMRAPQDVVMTQVESKSCKSDHAHEKSSEIENTKDTLTEDDMASSASTISEKHLKEDQTRHTAQLLSETKTDEHLKNVEPLEDTLKEKDSEIDLITLKDLPQKSVMSDNMKSVKDNEEEKHKKIVPTEGLDSIDASTNIMKSVETEDVIIENQKKAAVSTESLEKIETDKTSNMKTAEHFDESLNNKNKKVDKTQHDLHTEQSKHIDTPLFAKSAEDVTNMKHELLDEAKMQRNIVANEPEEHLSEAKMARNVAPKTQHEILASDKNMEKMELQEEQSLLHPDMRSADFNILQNQQMMNTPTQWSDRKNMQLQRESMPSANGMHSHLVQHPGHHHHVTHGMNNKHFEIPTGHGLQSRFPEHFMTQEKSADSDMQAYYMSMRDGSGLASENHRFRWQPTHEAPRTAYGPPAAPVLSSQSSGAVGLFPNANVGSCGIPLLLSCNPSVVSGSLAKPAPVSYPAPAYRTEDDFTFHTKRDVKKIHENLSSPLHRTSKANLKSSTVLVGKQ